MVYYTFFPKAAAAPQISMDAWLQLMQEDLTKGIDNRISSFPQTHTVLTDKSLYSIPYSPIKKAELMSKAAELPMEYKTYETPKASGGLRRISEPNELLKEWQRELKDLIGVLPHNAAHAYVARRGIKTANLVHQNNKSNWFAKIDIKDFFPSISLQVLTTQYNKIHGLDLLLRTSPDILVYCLLNDGLPQGAPTSPLLSNLVMVPFDYHLTEFCWKHHLVYTRYADDIIISSRKTFDYRDIETTIKNLFLQLDYPFKINTAKTRYGSIAGSNWNLGLMLNKDHQLTIGHRRKQGIKAGVNNFLKDFTTDSRWGIMETQRLLGELSFLKQIEPEYHDFIIARLEKKTHGLNFKACYKTILG